MLYENEKFLYELSPEEILGLQYEAETLGKPYVAALKEQLGRLGIPTV